MARYGPIRTRSRRVGIVALLLIAYLFVSPLPGRAIGASTWTAISVGDFHSCALATDGSAWCWGDNQVGELGDGNGGPGQYLNPQPVAVSTAGGAPSSYAAIDVGIVHTCALATDGAVWCWGYGYEGQLGNGSPSESAVPLKVPGTGAGGTVFSSISAGGHTCGLTAAGVAWCWGANFYGQVGNGSTTTSNSGVFDPTEVVTTNLGGAHFLEISAGRHHTCGLASDAKVWCWGRGNSGQLGNGASSNSTALVQVTGTGSGVGQTNLATVSAGGEHTCGVELDHTLFCWGKNGDGQLGDETTTARSSPVPVAGLFASFAVISAGAYHTCARQLGTDAFCWGDNADGQLGDGTTIDRGSPVAAGGDGYVSISAGAEHTCAIRSLDSTAWCWGGNFYGELGDGTSTGSTSSVQVLGGPSGGGCTQNPPASACHLVTYEILSARSIALEDTSTVDFGRVRQGHTADALGPDVYYATTWAGDAITVVLSEDSQLGVKLLFDVLTVSAPSGTVQCTDPGTDPADPDAVELTTDPVPVITGIDACGVPGSTDGVDGATATTSFTLDATGANDLGTNYTVPVTTTVTYTIDAG